jgi:hypothetical protein
VIKDDHMQAETESNRGSWLGFAIVTFVSLPVFYILSWAPTAALAKRRDFENRALEVVYSPLHWAAWNIPGMYAPLEWYWDRFDFLRLDSDARARPLIYTTSSSASDPSVSEVERR